MSKNLKTASVLAFERKLANSDALLYAGEWDDRTRADCWEPIAVKSKDVRGTISNREKTGDQTDPAKLDAKIQNANLQRVDVAALPFRADTLGVRFSLRVHGNLDRPSACNNPEYQEALSSVINQYAQAHRFDELAMRYATNIANGRFLWRNRVGAEAVEIRVRHTENRSTVKEWIFNAHGYDLRTFQMRDEQLRELAAVIQLGLSGQAPTLLLIDAFVHMGPGQEVFPSQELILDRNDKNKEGKKLYQVDGIAAMHSQKIGNALRTIDTWHSEVDQVGPIAVESFGAVTNRGKAYRQPSKKEDFYSLLDNWVCKGKELDVSQQHYVIAMLIRGGVFGEKE